VDGDSQGVERLLGALSAHMWPGMILKSGNQITTPSLIEKEGELNQENNVLTVCTYISKSAAWFCDALMSHSCSNKPTI
jgi:hypothetical protein